MGWATRGGAGLTRGSRRRIHAALGDAETVLNVGAGTGSYEPRDRWVLAVEPSATMRAQRPPSAAPRFAAAAESLPLDDDSVDAAMACVTIHHWRGRDAGLAEMRRVARGPVVVFTFELDRAVALAARLPASRRRDRAPALRHDRGGRGRARWADSDRDDPDPRRLHRRLLRGLLEPARGAPRPGVRASQSLWQLLEPGVEEEIVDSSRRATSSPAAGTKSTAHLRRDGVYEGVAAPVISTAGGPSAEAASRASAGRARGRAG